MNRFDIKYEIRLAKYDDIDNIMEFIHLNWKKDHILSRDRKYFEYEFLDEDGVNFILAISRDTNKIEAILGFLKASNSKKKKDIWGSLWKVRDSQENEKLLGVELEKRVKELTQCRYHNGIGLNPKTAVPLVRMFIGNTVKKMNHFYMLNDTLGDYKIAVVNKIPHINISLQEAKIYEISDFSELKNKFSINNNSNIPYKDEWYVEKKFFCNPKRKYKVYAINSEINEDLFDAFFITRECEGNGRKVLRIVDYYGDRRAFSRIGQNLRNYMLKEHYEYIDFYNWGFEKEYILQAGFVEREKNCENIIPNYFEPFIRENCEIWIHFKEDETMFFKADGDQDRANM